MKAIKRLIAICLTGAMVTSVVACGSATDSSTTESSAATSDGSVATEKTGDEASSSSDKSEPTEYLEDTGEAALTVNGQKISKLLYDANVKAISENVAPASVSGEIEAYKDALIKQAVIEQYFTDNATDEEKAEIQTEADAQYDQYIQQFMMQMMQQGQLQMDENATDEEMMAKAEDAYAQYLAEQGLTLGLLKESIVSSLNYNKGVEKIKSEISVSDEEAKKWYDETIITQRQDYATDPSAFDTAMSLDPPAAVTAPEGYAYYKHVLIGLSDEDKNKVVQLQTELDTLTSELATNMAALSPDEAKTKDLESQIALKRAEILKVYDSILAKSEEVLTKAKAGEDFDALIDQYGEDDGMKTEPTKTTGYLVGPGSQNYMAAFTQGALSLSKVGDISEFVYTPYGIHILKRIKDVPAGDFAFEDVKELAISSVQTQETQETVDAKSTELVEKAKIEDFTK